MLSICDTYTYDEVVIDLFSESTLMIFFVGQMEWNVILIASNVICFKNGLNQG